MKMPFDLLLMFFNAEDTASWSASDHDSSGDGILFVSGGGLDDIASPELQVGWPGIAGESGATVQFVVQDSADGSTGWADVLSSEVFDAETPDPDINEFRMPLPKQGVRSYLRLRVTVGTAALTSGSGPLTVGLVGQ